MLTTEAITDALRTVKYPGYSRDIVSFGLLKEVNAGNGGIQVTLQLASGTPALADELKANCEKALAALAPSGRVSIDVKLPETPRPAAAGPNPWAQQSRVPGLRYVVAVASGKGGVGKSTCAVNLACALRQSGARVGLLDCDIYGPSVPLMMGVRERPGINDQEKMVPPVGYGIKLMSIGFLLDGDAPVIWRGPMITKTIQQFLNSVDWGELDYLLVDLPPGTGDAQLSLCQTVPLDGGVIVTTPQEASLGVVRKGIAMFAKVKVPILGIIENMSYFKTPGGERFEIFGHGGGMAEAERQKLDFLGEIPILTEIREGGDRGIPVSAEASDGEGAKAFAEIAKKIRRKLP